MQRLAIKANAAHYYAADMGWKIFPVHNVTNGVCSCSKGAACENKGKHPRTVHGLKDATNDVKLVDEWWRTWPEANIGILTGSANGFFILDVDGEVGQNTVTEYSKDAPKDMPVVLTGSGNGYQFYFKLYRADIKNSVKKIAPGLDIRGEGGYGILPPSDHKSGNTYEWVTAPEAPPADAPRWLREIMDRAEIGRFISESNGEVQEEIAEGSRNDSLFKFGCLLRRRGFNRSEIADMLKVYNQRCKPPLSDSEVQQIAESSEKYKIEDPIAPSAPEDFFTKTKSGEPADFVPKRLGDHIAAQFRFASTEPRAPISFYNPKTGSWLRTGEQTIRTLAYKYLDEYARRGRVEETVAYIQDTHYVDRDIFDADTTRIPVLNGNLNLETGELEPHNPELYALTYVPRKYDKLAKCPTWAKFIKSVFSREDIAFIQEWCGYHLLRDYPHQYALMLLGDGSNGKSTFLKTLRYVIGENNCKAYSLTDILYNKFASAGLYGRLANIAADISDDEISKSAKFKAMVGGDPIPAEEKFRPGFDFINYAKLSFSANTLPKTADTTSAFFRRWRIVNCPNTFTAENRDVNLYAKLKAEAEGILAWMVVGLQRLLRNGRFSNAKSTTEIQDQWEELSNPFDAWVKNCVQENPDSELKKDTIYASYVYFCKASGMPYTGDNPFWKKVKPAFYKLSDTRPKREDGSRPHCKKGVELKCLSCEAAKCEFDVYASEACPGSPGSPGNSNRTAGQKLFTEYGEREKDRKLPGRMDSSDTEVVKKLREAERLVKDGNGN